MLIWVLGCLDAVVQFPARRLTWFISRTKHKAIWKKNIKKQANDDMPLLGLNPNPVKPGNILKMEMWTSEKKNNKQSTTSKICEATTTSREANDRRRQDVGVSRESWLLPLAEPRPSPHQSTTSARWCVLWTQNSMNEHCALEVLSGRCFRPLLDVYLLIATMRCHTSLTYVVYWDQQAESIKLLSWLLILNDEIGIREVV